MCDGCVAVLGGGKITVTIDADRHAIKFLQGAGGFFQKAAPATRRAQNLLAGCIFDGLACQKCFCVTLDKSNRTPAAAGKREEVRFYEENDQCRGR